MNRDKQRRVSKFLSLVLRHQPHQIGIRLDDAGWVSVDELLVALEIHGRGVERCQLDQVVAENDKQRFEFSDDGKKIRARQGHSIKVDLGYTIVAPPDVLHHGTPRQFVESIRQEGLTKQKRHHVHLHEDVSLATTVGRRRGDPVVLTVDAKEMHIAGHKFFVTKNAVWLTDCVPPEFIKFPDV